LKKNSFLLFLRSPCHVAQLALQSSLLCFYLFIFPRVEPVHSGPAHLASPEVLFFHSFSALALKFRPAKPPGPCGMLTFLLWPNQIEPAPSQPAEALSRRAPHAALLRRSKLN
jgi:hypothetical protein